MTVEKVSACGSVVRSAPWLNRGESQTAVKTLMYKNREFKVVSYLGFAIEVESKIVLSITCHLYINSATPAMSIARCISPDFAGTLNIRLRVKLRVLTTP